MARQVVLVGRLVSMTRAEAARAIASSGGELAELVGAGISLAKVRCGLAQLQHWLPGVNQPLADLRLSEDARRLIVRTPAGRRAETTGQLLFEFDPPTNQPLVEFCRTESEA